MAQTPPAQPLTTSPSVAKVPTAVAQLAASSQLGSCSRVYRQLSKIQSLGIGLGLLVLGLLLCSGGGWLGQNLNLGGRPADYLAYISLGVCLPFFGGAVFFIAFAINTKRISVYLYTRGLILTSKSSKSGLEVYRWDQIGGLRETRVVEKVRKYRAMTHCYGIRRLDGQQVTLSDHLPWMKKLWPIITQEVNAVLWPRIQSLYQQGKKHLIRSPHYQSARNKHQQGSVAVGSGEELHASQWAGSRREAGPAGSLGRHRHR